MEKEREEWRPVHEIVIEMLKECRKTMQDHRKFLTLAEIYKRGAKVPLNGIPPLIEILEQERQECCAYPEELDPEGVIEQAIVALRKQEREDLLRISEDKKRKRIYRKENPILLEDAMRAIKEVIEAAKKDLGSEKGQPVAVAVMGSNFKLIAMAAMDGVMPVSVDLCIKKAYTALAGQRDTIEWEKEERTGLDGRNFADPNWTCFGGGVLVKGHNGKVIGAVGVSGRLSCRPKDMEIPPQDHELAKIAAKWLEENIPI